MDRPNGSRPMPQPARTAFAPSPPQIDRSEALYSAPFSSYAPTFISQRLSPYAQPVPLPLVADTSGIEVAHDDGERILLQQSINRASVSSTSSLVSAGGRAIGRPMGIPPATESVPRSELSLICTRLATHGSLPQNQSDLCSGPSTHPSRSRSRCTPLMVGSVLRVCDVRCFVLASHDRQSHQIV